MKMDPTSTFLSTQLWLHPQCAPYLLMLALALSLAPAAAHAQTLTVLHSFTGVNGDGMEPTAGLARDSANNLYGTTTFGGAFGLGIIFKIDSSGTETVLHTFAGASDGASPQGTLLRDAAGNLYGTTTSGGPANMGTVFELDTAGVQHVLHSFNGTDGAAPLAGLAADASGNLYGTTSIGGTNGEGTVFKINRSGTAFRVLHNFVLESEDGFDPRGGVVLDPAGNIYGTTTSGGKNAFGTVFRLSPSGTETILANFGNGMAGGNPLAGLLRDTAGNLYGTAGGGGRFGDGTVFTINSAGTLTVLHSFNGADGVGPTGPLIRDAAGNLYGMTEAVNIAGPGLIYKLDPAGTYTVLHTFTVVDGSDPMGNLVQDASGNLYGTTFRGGTNNEGVVFKYTP